jgi:hypothetical protein
LANTTHTDDTASTSAVDVEGTRAQFGDRDLHQVGDDFHAAAGTGGALVVHQEVGDLALFVAVDGLAVLAAHVEDGAHAVAAHVVGAAGMAGDLGDRLVGEGHVDPAVAGADHEVDVFQLHAALVHHALKGVLGRIRRVVAGAHAVVAVEFAIHHQHGLRRHGADVDAAGDDLGGLPVLGLVDPDVFLPAPEFLLLGERIGFHFCIHVLSPGISAGVRRRSGRNPAR